MNRLLLIFTILIALNAICTNVSAEVNIDFLKQKYQKCKDPLYRHDCFDNYIYSKTKKVGYFKNNDLWEGLVYQGNVLIFEYKNGNRNVKSSCSKSNDGWINCPSGNRYIPLDSGYFDENGRQGMFKYEFKSGSTYIGEYKNGKRHGQGKFFYFNGDKFVGEYKNGKRHGQGTYFYANGDKYEGEYKNGVSNGQGKYTYKGGKIKEGIWKDGRFLYAQKKSTPLSSNSKPSCPSSEYRHNCYGRHTFPDGSTYIGEWKNNKYNGQGIYTFANGDRYMGNHKDGKAHGQGTFNYVSGAKYVGLHKNHKYHGEGEYTWADGRKDVGEFKDGKLNGFAIRYDKFGIILKEGIWKDDKFLYTQKKPILNLNSKLDKYKSFCSEIGFTPGTEKFGDCVLEAMKKD